MNINLRTNFLFIILLLISINVFGQNDTIVLKEVVVESKYKTPKLELKSKGSAVSFSNHLVDGFLTKFNDVPVGTLSSITIYFNASLADFFKKNSNRQTVDFKLLIHDAKVDGTLGSSLYDEEVIFKVDKNHRGKIILDVGSIAISTSTTMYFGVETMEKTDSGSFAIMMEKNLESKTYLKIKNGDWIEMPESYQIKLQAEIKQ